MNKRLTMKQRRAKKNKEERKIETERKLRDIIQNKMPIQQKPIQMQRPSSKPQHQQKDFVINYVADRNGCGYYRCIWPFELLSTNEDVMSMNCFVYQHDLKILNSVSCFRFQRQATTTQRKI